MALNPVYTDPYAMPTAGPASTAPVTTNNAPNAAGFPAMSPTGAPWASGDRWTNPTDNNVYQYDGTKWISATGVAQAPTAPAGGWQTPPSQFTGTPMGTANTSAPAFDAGQFNSSGFQWPTFTPPTYMPPPAYAPAQSTFSYGNFQAPTLADAQNAPGYQFGATEGAKALEQSAAAKGVLRTGGTLKDLLSWGNQFATQNYNNVFNQDAQAYSLNQNNALSNFNVNNQTGLNTYNTNAAQTQNTYQNQYQNAVAAFNPQFQSASLSFADLFNRWKAGLDATTTIAAAGASGA